MKIVAVPPCLHFRHKNNKIGPINCFTSELQHRFVYKLISAWRRIGISSFFESYETFYPPRLQRTSMKFIIFIQKYRFIRNDGLFTIPQGEEGENWPLSLRKRILAAIAHWLNTSLFFVSQMSVPQFNLWHQDRRKIGEIKSFNQLVISLYKTENTGLNFCSWTFPQQDLFHSQMQHLKIVTDQSFNFHLSYRQLTAKNGQKSFSSDPVDAPEPHGLQCPRE